MTTLINSSVQPYNAADYIQTAGSANRVSRKAKIHGGGQIVLGGKCIIHHHAIIRGDLRRLTPKSATTDGKEGSTAAATSPTATVITMGRYCTLGEGSVIRPAYKTYKGVFSFYPTRIGDHVHIGADSIIEAVTIGNHVDIGRDCVLGKLSIVKDSVRILDGSIVAPGTVLPSGSIWAGSPARDIGELAESFPEQHEIRTKDYYARFRPASA